MIVCFTAIDNPDLLPVTYYKHFLASRNQDLSEGRTCTLAFSVLQAKPCSVIETSRESSNTTYGKPWNDKRRRHREQHKTCGLSTQCVTQSLPVVRRGVFPFWLLWKSLSRVRLCDPVDFRVHGALQARILEGSLSLLQGIFPTQGSNPGLPHGGQTLYQLSHKGSPRTLERVASSSWSASMWQGSFLFHFWRSKYTYLK